jgi:hypothetical protein
VRDIFSGVVRNPDLKKFQIKTLNLWIEITCSIVPCKNPAKILSRKNLHAKYCEKGF